MKTTLNVQGMTCGHCEKAVNGALMSVEGVKEVEVHLDSGKVDVAYEETATIEQMKEEVEEQGYEIV